MMRYIWSFMVELVGAIICIISPKFIEISEGDKSDADAAADGTSGGGGGISEGESSDDEEENCGGGGGKSSSGGGDGGCRFSDSSNCDDGDNAGS